MDVELVWSKRADQGYARILEPSRSHKDLYRGPINRLTIVTYRYKPRAKKIILVNIREARKKPLK